MKYQIKVIFKDLVLISKPHDEDKLAEIKRLLSQINELGHLGFNGTEGEKYYIPQDVIQQSIIMLVPVLEGKKDA